MNNKSIRIALVQYGMRKISNFNEFAHQIEYFVSTAKDYKADYVLFSRTYNAAAFIVH